VPILLLDQSQVEVAHEAELVLREGYDPWVHRMVLQSLADDQVVLDAGCGNMRLDDPCIIRMDVQLTPYVDVVGDLHALPFKPATLDYIFSLAVIEHLRQPFTAAAEMYSALKPGGYVYGESNFVFAYHGYPDHYFNASIHGLQQVFAQFATLRLGVAPYQTPSFAVEHVLSNYLAFFQPQTPPEERFARLLRHALTYPLHHYDARFPKEAWFRLAAGVCFLGLKQPGGSESVIPAPVLSAYRASTELQSRFPNPNDLSLPDNLMIWAKTEGSRQHPEVAAYFANLQPFAKAGQAADRSWIHNLAPIPDPDSQFIDEPNHSQLEAEADAALHSLTSPLGAGSLWAKVVHTYRQQGAVELARKAVRAARRKLVRAHG
jgi:SAM-dependent methyltransferase